MATTAPITPFVPLTVRAFYADIRISTAVALQEGGVLEVYPFPKKTHASWEAWKAQYPSARFEETVRPAETARQARMRSKFSYPVPSDTPLQQTVRQLFSEYGNGRSTLRCGKLNPKTHGRRIERIYNFTGLWVLRHDTKTLECVSFHFESGTVMFENTLVGDLPLDTLTFFHQPFCYAKMIQVNPTFAYRPNTPTVVLFPNRHSQIHVNLIHLLQKAGFSVLLCRPPLRECLSEYAMFAFTLPDVKHVLEEHYDCVTPYRTDGRIYESFSIHRWFATLQIPISDDTRPLLATAPQDPQPLQPPPPPAEKKIETSPPPSTSTPSI